MASADGTVLATGSTSITFNCSNITVGKADSPASLGAVVLPCTFTGTVTVAGEGYAAGHAYKAKKIYEETLSLFQ